MSNASKNPRESDTVRDLPKPRHVLRDTVPEQAGVYVGPRPLAPTSDHRTIQIKPVVLASHVDPRRAPTELRLSAPPPPAPARHVGWLIPLALLAIALGVFLAIRVTDAPPVVPGISDPKSEGVGPRTSTANHATAGTATVTNAAPDLAGTPAVDVRALPVVPPSQSATARKKPRDPWLE
jgi:hypothetical protein